MNLKFINLCFPTLTIRNPCSFERIARTVFSWNCPCKFQIDEPVPHQICQLLAYYFFGWIRWGILQTLWWKQDGRVCKDLVHHWGVRKRTRYIPIFLVSISLIVIILSSITSSTSSVETILISESFVRSVICRWAWEISYLLDWEISCESCCSVPPDENRANQTWYFVQKKEAKKIRDRSTSLVLFKDKMTLNKPFRKSSVRIQAELQYNKRTKVIILHRQQKC